MGLLLLVLATSARAITRDLGTVGATYPVIEPDILAELKARVAGNLPTREELLRRIRTYQPGNLRKLPRATENRKFLVDMTYTLDHDVKDHDGRILYPRGYTFNPLDYVSFPGGMVVIDGSDPVQVGWFRKSPYYDNHRARLLVCGGYAHELVERFKRPVYYLTDTVARRLQLAAVPSVIVQKGKKLLVREIHLEEDERR